MVQRLDQLGVRLDPRQLPAPERGLCRTTASPSAVASSSVGQGLVGPGPAPAPRRAAASSDVAQRRGRRVAGWRPGPRSSSGGQDGPACAAERSARRWPPAGPGRSRPPRPASGRSPGPDRAARVITMTDCTPAWMIISWPAPSRVASDIASATTTMICQTPVPKTRTKRSPTQTPTRHADRDLDAAPQPLAVGDAEGDDRRHRGEERRRVARAARSATNQASPAVTAHWAIRNQRRPPARQPALRRVASRSRAVRSLRSNARAASTRSSAERRRTES